MYFRRYCKLWPRCRINHNRELNELTQAARTHTIDVVSVDKTRLTFIQSMTRVFLTGRQYY